MRFTVALMMTLATLSLAALPTASQAASTSCSVNTGTPQSLVDESDDNNPDFQFYANCSQATNTHMSHAAHAVARMNHARSSVY